MSKPHCCLSSPEVEAQLRFDRFLAKLEDISQRTAADRKQWADTCSRHVHFLYGTTWVGLVLIGCAIMANWWLVWTGLFFAFVGIFFTCAAKVAEHQSERMAHECRLTALQRERDAVLNGGPSIY